MTPATIEIGVPATTPKSRPLAPINSGQGKNPQASSEEMAMNTSGAPIPKPSTVSRTSSGDPTDRKRDQQRRGGDAHRERDQTQPRAHVAFHAAARA